MFDIVVEGLADLQERFAQLPAALNAALLAKSQVLADALAQKIRDEKLSGEALENRSGLLKASIESGTEEDGDVSGASVFVAGDVPYAAIQEYGGETKAHVIEATNAKVLAFGRQNGAAFARYVNHPGSVIPEHSYLRSALGEMQDDIVQGFAGALAEGFQQ